MPGNAAEFRGISAEYRKGEKVSEYRGIPRYAEVMKYETDRFVLSLGTVRSGAE